MILNAPSVLIGMASRFGLLSPTQALLLSGLKAAPVPTKTILTEDWLSNLDVMSGALGCVVAGVFDQLVAPYNKEELIDLDPAPLLENLQLPPIVNTALMGCFGVCVEAYLEYGPLSKAIKDGRVPSEGLVVAGVLRPFIQSAPLTGTAKSDGLLKRKSLIENENLEASLRV